MPYSGPIQQCGGKNIDSQYVSTEFLFKNVSCNGAFHIKILDKFPRSLKESVAHDLVISVRLLNPKR
jgi:hypothetical protein